MDDIKRCYDFVVCGAGSAGCTVAGRLAQGGDATVLLLEAGGDDQAEAVLDPDAWPTNIGTERDWGFVAQPNPALEGRALPLSMGKLLGGGSSINGLMWIRGHREDWDGFAAETGDPGWGHEAVEALYRRIEDWRGASDKFHGRDGPVAIETAANRTGVRPLLLDAAASLGLPVHASPNGAMMSTRAAAAEMDVIVRDGRRCSMYRNYVAPIADRDNLDIKTGATVSRIVVERGRATGVEATWRGARYSISADREVVVCQGAINSPKLLFQSGIGAENDLRDLGIPVAAILPGVGANFQDHVMTFGLVWETLDGGFAPNGSRAILQAPSGGRPGAPDLQLLQTAGGGIPAEMEARGIFLNRWWSLAPGIVRPKSRGRLRFTGAGVDDPVEIDGGHLSHPDDVRAAIAGVRLCLDLAESDTMRSRIRRRIIPEATDDETLMELVRRRTVTYWHQSGTAKMGVDDMSVVDGQLRLYGIDGLRVADSSVMPHVIAGNIMAPCVVIGERAADLIGRRHGITVSVEPKTPRL